MAAVTHTTGLFSTMVSVWLLKQEEREEAEGDSRGAGVDFLFEVIVCLLRALGLICGPVQQ